MYVRKYVCITSTSWREVDSCAPHCRPPVLEFKIGKRRKFLYLSVEPKCSPLALDRIVCMYAGKRRGPDRASVEVPVP